MPESTVSEKLPPGSAVADREQGPAFDIEPDVEPRLTRGRTKKSFDGKSIFINIVLPLLLIGFAIGLVLLFGTVEPAQRPPLDTTRLGRLKALPPVQTEILKSLADVKARLTLDVDGVVIPYREARVAAEVSGKVIFKVPICEAGQFVEAGTLLMKIDATDYELEVERLTRLRQQEYQSLQELDQEVVNTQRLIDVAEKDVALQEKEVARQKAMPAGFASNAEIDQANRALLASQQQLVTLENLTDLLIKRRTRLEASEQLATTQLRAAEVNLERTEIRAPIEGVIVSEEADLNTFVNRGSTLLIIDDTSKVEVATKLRMDQLYWVLDQDGVTLDPSARGYDLPETPAIIEYELSGREGVAYRWPARLLSYDGIGLDRETRTVPVRVVVDDPQARVDELGEPTESQSGGALVRGMYVKVRLLINPRTPLVLIPARALQPGNRVYEFVADETVLDRPDADTDNSPRNSQQTFAAEPGQTEPGQMGSDEQAPALDDDVFDPDRWVPGRVMVRTQVTPVDSMVVRTKRSGDGDRMSARDNPDGDDEKWWVCEVPGKALTNQAHVVVSPVGTVAGESMPARAEKATIADEDPAL